MPAQIVQEPFDLSDPTASTNPGSSALSARPSTRERLQEAAGTRATSDLPHACRCGARWSGALTSHCSACHRTFGGVGSFDRHRRDGACLDPVTIGLTVLAGRAYECWGTVEGSEGQRGSE